MHNNLLSAVRQFEKTQALVAATTIPSKHTPLERFQMICDRERIRVIDDLPMISLFGLHAKIRERDFIILNPQMTREEREFVAFHELGHYLHGHTKEDLHSEFDANFFAFLSLRPQEVAK